MRALTLMPLFSIILLLGGQIPLAPQYAYASHCCGCTCKPWMCACMGTSHCPVLMCHTDDSPSLQAETVTNSQHLDISAAYASSPSRSHRINRLINIASFGECARTHSPTEFFKNAEDRLRFEPDFINFHISEEDNINIAANQMSVNE
jgi:hypothetical protein